MVLRLCACPTQFQIPIRQHLFLQIKNETMYVAINHILYVLNKCIMVVVPHLYTHYTVCEITFETWADTPSGHNKIYTDTSGVVWTSC